jgi:hypothetical protein
MNELETITRYLEEWDGKSEWKSSLEAALRDARVTMEHGQALWLATLGYLSVVEQIGFRLARPSTQFPQRNGKGKRFRAGVLEFGPNPSDTKLADAMWSLRCALSHEYGLASEQKRIFMLTRTTTLIIHPTTQWDGSIEGAKSLDCQTIMSVTAIGKYVEELVSTVREEATTGGVISAPGSHWDELALFGGLYSSD